MGVRRKEEPDLRGSFEVDWVWDSPDSEGWRRGRDCGWPWGRRQLGRFRNGDSFHQIKTVKGGTCLRGKDFWRQCLLQVVMRNETDDSKSGQKRQAPGRGPGLVREAWHKGTGGPKSSVCEGRLVQELTSLSVSAGSRTQRTVSLFTQSGKVNSVL